MVSGIFTLIGALVIIALSIKVFVDIFNYTNITAKMEYIQYDISDYNSTLTEFLNKTNIQFKVKAYDFWELNNEPLDCGLFIVSFDYLIPTGVDPIKMPLVCVEVNEALMYSIPLLANKDIYDAIKI